MTIDVRRRSIQVVLTTLTFAILWAPTVTASIRQVEAPGPLTNDDGFQQPWGTYGQATPAKASCEFTAGQARIIMYPPVNMTATYDTSNVEAQVVYWQPRLWYKISETQVGVTPWGQFGWHYTISRSGFDESGSWAAPVPICAGGTPCLPGSAPMGATSGMVDSWTTESDGVTHDVGWGLPAYPNLAVARAWAVENVYEWEENISQPVDGGYGELVGMLVDLVDTGATVCVYT